MTYSTIISTARYEPATVVTNADLEEQLNTTDEWIYSHSGIRERRKAQSKETPAHMAREVIDQLLESTIVSSNAGIILVSNSHVPGVIPCAASAYATTGHCAAFDFLAPTCDTIKRALAMTFDIYSILVNAPHNRGHRELTSGRGVGTKNCFAFYQSTEGLAQLLACEYGLNADASFDLATGCSSFVYACALADSLVKAQQMPYLVIAVEKMSDVIDEKDRETAYLFGDLAAGVVVAPSLEPGFIAHSLRTDATNRSLITVNTYGKVTFSGNGSRILKYGVRTLQEYAELFVSYAASRHILIPHQANTRILDKAREKAEFERIDDVIMTLEQFGNSSAASIPHALDIAVQSERIRRGDFIGLVGFGAGLSDGLTVLRWTC